MGVACAGRVAKASILHLTWLAGQRSANCAVVGGLGAGDANVFHTIGAGGRTDTATDVVEVLLAYRVP